MASFSLLDQVVRTAVDAGVDDNGSFTLYVNPTPITVGGGNDSFKVIIVYENFIPEFGQDPQTFDLDAHVEGKNGDQWYTLANQFSPARNAQQGPQRILIMEPTINGGDAGVDNIVSQGDDIAARQSLTHGKFGGVTEFRICVTVTERGYVNGVAAPGSFQSVKLTIFGETYA